MLRSSANPARKYTGTDGSAGKALRESGEAT